MIISHAIAQANIEPAKKVLLEVEESLKFVFVPQVLYCAYVVYNTEEDVHELAESLTRSFFFIFCLIRYKFGD